MCARSLVMLCVLGRWPSWQEYHLQWCKWPPAWASNWSAASRSDLLTHRVSLQCLPSANKAKLCMMFNQMLFIRHRITCKPLHAHLNMHMHLPFLMRRML